MLTEATSFKYITKHYIIKAIINRTRSLLLNLPLLFLQLSSLKLLVFKLENVKYNLIKEGLNAFRGLFYLIYANLSITISFNIYNIKKITYTSF